MLDGGLTHMNGRLYDPVLARFVSADPHVDNPFDLQSLNRYSYVNNNPLGYTDPTGYFKLFGKKWSWWRDKVVKPVVAIAAAWVIGPAAYNFGFWGAGGAALGAGMSAGAATFIGGVAGGALAGAAIGGITGGIFNGPESILQGMKYGAIGGAITGPAAAFYGSSSWGMERLAAQSVSGGLASAAQGGSFADGFRNSFATGSAAWLYTSTVYADTTGRAANPMPGQRLASPDGTYSALRDGRVPENLITTNLIGLNDPNNPAVFTGNAWSDLWANLGKQGGFPGTIVNYIPGINATGVLHDTWWNPVNGRPGTMFGFGFNAFTNWGTMLPAAAVTYGALLNDPYARQSIMIDRIRK